MSALDDLLKGSASGDITMGNFVLRLLAEAHDVPAVEVAARLPPLLAAYTATALPSVEIELSPKIQEFADKLLLALRDGPLRDVDPQAVVDAWVKSVLQRPKPRRIRVRRADG